MNPATSLAPHMDPLLLSQLQLQQLQATQSMAKFNQEAAMMGRAAQDCADLDRLLLTYPTNNMEKVQQVQSQEDQARVRQQAQLAEQTRANHLALTEHNQQMERLLAQNARMERVWKAHHDEMVQRQQVQAQAEAFARAEQEKVAAEQARLQAELQGAHQSPQSEPTEVAQEVDHEAQMRLQAEANARQVQAQAESYFQAQVQTYIQTPLPTPILAPVQDHASSLAQLQAHVQASTQSPAQLHGQVRLEDYIQAHAQAMAQAHLQGHVPAHVQDQTVSSLAQLQAYVQASTQAPGQAHTPVQTPNQVLGSAQTPVLATIQTPILTPPQVLSAQASVHATTSTPVQDQFQAHTQASNQSPILTPPQVFAQVHTPVQDQHQAHLQTLVQATPVQTQHAQSPAQLLADSLAQLQAQAQAQAQDLVSVQGSTAQTLVNLQDQVQAQAQGHLQPPVLSPLLPYPTDLDTRDRTQIEAMARAAAEQAIRSPIKPPPILSPSGIVETRTEHNEAQTREHAEMDLRARVQVKLDEARAEQDAIDARKAQDQAEAEAYQAEQARLAQVRSEQIARIQSQYADLDRDKRAEQYRIHEEANRARLEQWKAVQAENERMERERIQAKLNAQDAQARLEHEQVDKVLAEQEAMKKSEKEQKAEQMARDRAQRRAQKRVMPPGPPVHFMPRTPLSPRLTEAQQRHVRECEMKAAELQRLLLPNAEDLSVIKHMLDLKEEAIIYMSLRYGRDRRLPQIPTFYKYFIYYLHTYITNKGAQPVYLSHLGNVAQQRLHEICPSEQNPRFPQMMEIVAEMRAMEQRLSGMSMPEREKACVADLEIIMGEAFTYLALHCEKYGVAPRAVLFLNRFCVVYQWFGFNMLEHFEVLIVQRLQRNLPSISPAFFRATFEGIHHTLTNSPRLR